MTKFMGGQGWEMEKEKKRVRERWKTEKLLSISISYK